MSQDNIIRKIEKCLALSKSANEHEAASALRQARKLMEQHNIEMGMVEEARIADIACDLPIQGGSKQPKYLEHFLWLIQKAFGVRSTCHQTVRVSDPSYTITYYGPKARVQCAAYAHTVVYRAALRGWENYKKEWGVDRMPRGARSSFLIGFFDNVRHGLPEFDWAEGEEDLLDKYTDKVCDGRRSKVNKIEIDNDAYVSGACVADDFQLRQGVQGQETVKIGN